MLNFRLLPAKTDDNFFQKIQKTPFLVHSTNFPQSFVLNSSFLILTVKQAINYEINSKTLAHLFKSYLPT